MIIKNISKILCCFLIIIFSLQTFGQCSYQIPIFKTEKLNKANYLLHDSLKHKKKNNDGLYFGISFGAYFANRYTAQYYNGSGVNRLNDSLIKSQYNYQNIETALAASDTSRYRLGELPAKMKYSPALMVGLFFKYDIKNSAIFFQFNFAKLKASDVFTILVWDTTKNTLSYPKQESISGSEQRMNMDIGYCYTFNPKKNYRPYFEFGFNLNNIKWVDNKIKIESVELSIENQKLAYYNINQGGLGIGAFIGGGINMIFNESISITPGFDIYFTKTNLGSYDQFKPNYTIFVKATLNGLL